jgi:hypothetical protein
MTFSAVSAAVRRGAATHRIDRGNMFRCVRGPPHNAMNNAARLSSPAGTLRRPRLASVIRRVMADRGQSGSRRRAAGEPAGGAAGESPAGRPPRRRPCPPGRLLMPLQSGPYALASCAHQTSCVTTATGRSRAVPAARALAGAGLAGPDLAGLGSGGTGSGEVFRAGRPTRAGSPRNLRENCITGWPRKLHGKIVFAFPRHLLIDKN